MSNINCPKCNVEFKFISVLKRHLKISSRCKSLEEEIINIRAPVATSPTIEFVGSDFKPVYDKMLDGASML